MERGKFEAPKGKKKAARSSAADVDTARRGGSGMSRAWPVLAAIAGVLVLVVGILILTENSRKNPVSATPNPTVELSGMKRADLERRFSELDIMVRKDLVLTLNPQVKEGEYTEEPLVLTISDAVSDVHLDLVQLTADLNAGVGRESEGADSFLLDPRNYLVYNKDSIREQVNEFVTEYGTEFTEPSIKLEDAPVTEPAPSEEDPSDTTEEGATPPPPDKLLTIQTGMVGRKLDADAICKAIEDAYSLALIAESPETVMQPSLTYELIAPPAVDLEALWKRFCKDPVEPELDVTTGEVTDGADGFGFDREALQAALEAADPGTEVQAILTVLKPTTDAETLRESLFHDILAEAHTDHTAVYNRTNNLILACAAIDGTVLLPGDEFSFNRVVGQRTEEKGYREALAYVSGGASRPELGGGVCQVASTIYYAVLQADLQTTERAAHMFLVDYVPFGMDATVYWGSLDYKFRNNSPYPIKIEASVSDGQVHVILYGTEWKDYTVELDYKILSKDDWEVVEREVPDDGTYYDGQVISTPYTGYKVVTYKTTKNKTTGVEETTQIAISEYSKRDKVIAKIKDDDEPTDPPTEPTSPPTEPTDEPTEPTDEPTEPTDEPTEPTDEPTEPTPEPTDEPPEPTDPPTEPPEPEPEPSEGGDD